MDLADWQPVSGTAIMVNCTVDELRTMPLPDNVTHYDEENVLATFVRTVPNLVALKLCGIDVSKV